MIDLNTIYSRYEDTGASVSYYGYTIQNSFSYQNTTDSNPEFSIKKVYTDGSVQYTQWSNNTIGSYESIWNDRAACFATPSDISSVSATSSFDGFRTNITFVWSSSVGASRYIANITNQNGVAITYLPDVSSSAVYNPEHKSNGLRFVNKTSCTLQNCATSNTYTISVYSTNGYGTSTPISANITI